MDNADLLKKMEDMNKESNVELQKILRPGGNGAAGDEMGVLITDLLWGAAEQVRKAAGGIDTEGLDISSIDASVLKYQDLMKKGAQSPGPMPPSSEPRDEIKN
ncbi:MAG: hypothetical protein LBJ15_16125 [Comamonas sp.]|jgi:hypothetical protein|uniref:hypothetical protein n=1 Tax=Comamonas sp. TaxID=34028 RepID=UPI00281F15EA|nr:hypothetical protein [Comamonas sp.]MDR0215512.1 hypothetical protein [Comamonas sp.]